MIKHPTRYAFLEHDGCLAFAHRGGAGDRLENTMAAFEYAVDLGYRYVETDVHATADGVLLAFHDEVLDRVTDRTGRIEHMTYAEVREARVGGTDSIPLLAEVLERWPDIRLNIDPKSDGAVAPLIELLCRMEVLEQVCITSFSDRRLAQVRDAMGPRLCTGMGPREVWRLAARSWRLPAGEFAAGCVQVPVRHGVIPIVTRRLIRTAERLGIHVHVWTIDEPNQMHELLDLGVHGLMTDRADVLKQVLTARGDWA